jgi:hypothetical protein
MQIQYLQNAASNVTGLIVHEKFFEDKRKKIKCYFLSLDGCCISPALDYENMNYFILGFLKCYQLKK